MNSRDSHVRARNESLRVHAEVRGPDIDPWIEKPHQRISHLPGDVATLGAIAEWAAESQIVFRSRSTVLLTDDVIDMESVYPIVLVQEAILANLSCALPDFFA